VGVVHASVEQNEEFDSPYYPQVWPSLVPSELKALENGLDADITLMGAITFMTKVADGVMTNRQMCRSYWANMLA
jgi:hypothetical protein